MSDIIVIEYFKQGLEKSNDQVRCSHSEDEHLEFKKSLHISSGVLSKEYLKTIAGFANNDGGTIVFGVEPENHILVGIHERAKKIDQSQITTTIKDGIDGEIYFKYLTEDIGGKTISFLQVFKSKRRPVIMKVDVNRDGENMKIGEIYFRYTAQDLRIKLADLRSLMSEEINNSTHKIANQLFSKISKIIEIGPENIALLNTVSGEIGDNNPNVKMVLHPDVLKNLNLIKEGQFDEKEGAPAYVIKGEIEVEKGGHSYFSSYRTETETIHTSDITKSFFQQECANPIPYLDEVVYHSSFYYPIYYFIKEAGLSKNEAIERLKGISNADVNINTKHKLLERLNNGITLKPNGCLLENINNDDIRLGKGIDKRLEDLRVAKHLSKNKEIALIRTIIFNRLMSGQTIQKFTQNYNLRCLQAFEHIPNLYIKENKDFILSELYSCYKAIDNTSSNEKSIFRKLLAWIDEALYS